MWQAVTKAKIKKALYKVNILNFGLSEKRRELIFVFFFKGTYNY